MEKSSARSLHQYFSLVEALAYFFLDSILTMICKIQKPCQSRTQVMHEKKITKEFIRREDLEIVTEMIGMSMSNEGEKIKGCLEFDEVSNMFEDEEPSFEEVKEVFNVFDENCDGFIDAKELQRVLEKLGFAEEMDLDACKLMIQAHDQDQDGKIGFNEFVRFMESCLC